MAVFVDVMAEEAALFSPWVNDTVQVSRTLSVTKQSCCTSEFEAMERISHLRWLSIGLAAIQRTNHGFVESVSIGKSF